jgi:monoamine oxidase
MGEENKCDVVVIGAGMAGLAAARAIAEAGLSVILVESRDRVGGRIRTVRDGGTVIELGAEFLHGRPPELWALIEEAGLETYERTGDFLRQSEDGPVAMGDWEDDDPLDSLKDFAGPDCSFVEYLDRVGFPEDKRRQEIGYAEGFNAAEATEASAMALGRQQRAEDEIDGDRSWRVTEGYDRLPGYLLERFKAAGGRIVLGDWIATVLWGTGRAELHSGCGNIYDCAKVVVAVPLGMLQTGGIVFRPEIPAVTLAASRMRMGHACRFTMVFSRRLWPEGMSFLLTQESMPPVWWTAHPHETRTLTGWAGGPRAVELLALNPDELRGRTITAAARALKVDEAEVAAALTGFHTHNWDTDTDSRGAYSWVPVGGLEASAEMSEPVSRTLYFAGEHTDTTGHWGTVHAALRSGLRAGRQVVEASMLGST